MGHHEKNKRGFWSKLYGIPFMFLTSGSDSNQNLHSPYFVTISGYV